MEENFEFVGQERGFGWKTGLGGNWEWMQRKMGLEGRDGDEAEPGRGREWEGRSGRAIGSKDEGMVWVSCSPLHPVKKRIL